MPRMSKIKAIRLSVESAVKAFVLLVAQRFDGIERGGFARWIKSEEHAHSGAEQECDGN